MLDVELFTDPACPFAFSAEPVRQRLRWHYGEGLRWTVRMIGLTREPGEAERLAEGAPGLQRRFGMPIDPRPYPRPASSEPACRAVVAARLHAPAGPEPLLRRLRVRVMQGGLLDDPELIAAAARDAGLDPGALAAWSAEPDTAAAVEDDFARARDPLPAARALDHKLGGPHGERRYTAPSYIIDGIAVPGFNPVEVYETVIANRAAQLARRPAPESAEQLLAWAQEPLATAEAALIMQTGIEPARAALRAVGHFEPAGADGYWSL
ncbi:MAG TPA: DsbA family protein [Solirubrobacteraceae bacterium]|nr:DsbA family protein [Solirubrobacteraceae bacterium]